MSNKQDLLEAVKQARTAVAACAAPALGLYEDLKDNMPAWFKRTTSRLASAQEHLRKLEEDLGRQP